MKKFAGWLLVLMGMVCGRVQAQGWLTLGPVPRYELSMAYDPGTDTAVIFGGQAANSVLLNDVWTAKSVTASADANLLGLTWVQSFPTGTAPSPRFGQSAVYSASNNRLLIFGGSTTAAGQCSSDLWVLNGANGSGNVSWTKVTPSGTAPAPRMAHTAIYDSANDVMTVFGGYDCAGHYLADVWALSSASGALGSPVWTQVTVNGSGPAARQFPTAVYDAGSNRMVIYGGDSGGSPWGDAWYLTNANGRGGSSAWTLLTPTGTAPKARTQHVAWYDAVNNRMMIADGWTGTTVLGDSFVLVNANGNGAASWTSLGAVAVGTAPTRRYNSAFYVPAINTAVTFGGVNGPSVIATAVEDHAFVLSIANGLP